jgi:hypothetical protein
MKVKAKHLSPKAVEGAEFLYGQQPQVLSTRVDEYPGYLDVESYCYMDREKGLFGGTRLSLVQGDDVPEHGHIVDGPSRDGVTLHFDREGQINAVQRLKPLYGRRPLADVILPSRRKDQMELTAVFAGRFINEAVRLIELRGDNPDGPPQ